MSDLSVIDGLRKVSEGRVITPADPDYDTARDVFYGGIDKRPAAIVRVAHAADVATAVSTAKTNGLELAVRSGGHSIAGHSTTDGGIVVDLRDLKSFELDGTTVWAGTGLSASEYTEQADAHNLATGFGDAGSVGIGGITLGGGVGFLARKNGLALDHVLAAEIVTADGEIRTVDANNDPDLFWAIRGGGGNFGVVTKLKFQLQPLDTVVGGMLILPATAENITQFVALADKAPRELSTIVNVMPAPPLPFVAPEHHGKVVIFALMTYAGPPADAEPVLADFRSIAPPIADMLRPIRYKEMFPPEGGPMKITATSLTLFLDQVDASTAETALRHVTESDAMMRVVQLRVLGGAVADVPADATAYAHRNNKIMTNVAAIYAAPEERPARERWVADLAAALNQGSDEAYVGFLGDESPERVRAAYPGTTWDRLVEIKRRYDPDNFFRLNQNITP